VRSLGQANTPGARRPAPLPLGGLNPPWRLPLKPQAGGGRRSHGQDYSCTTEDGRAILAAAVPGPAGFAVLSQEIEPDDYRGRAVTFRGGLRAADVAGRAGLVLRIPRQGRRPAPPDPWHDPENHFAPGAGTRDWTRHEVTAQVPAGATSIIFGVFLNGRGQIELRNPQLDPHPANR
jgi:hypothetical protein